MKYGSGIARESIITREKAGFFADAVRSKITPLWHLNNPHQFISDIISFEFILWCIVLVPSRSTNPELVSAIDSGQFCFLARVTGLHKAPWFEQHLQLI